MSEGKRRVQCPRSWQFDMLGRSDNFHSQLFRLIAKADKINYQCLRRGFPVEVAYYETWCKSTNPTKFPQFVEVDKNLLGGE